MPSWAKRSSGWSHPRFGFPTPKGVCPEVETVAGGLPVLPFLRIGILTPLNHPEIQEVLISYFIYIKIRELVFL